MLKFLEGNEYYGTFTSVFHRILDFKAGLDFYLGPFFLPQRLKDTNFHELVSRKARKVAKP